MTNYFKRYFFLAFFLLLLFGFLTEGNNGISAALADALAEMPFIGQTWELASKVIGLKGGYSFSSRAFSDDIIRSIFVALAAIPFQRIFGLMFGFHYTGKETYDTPLSLGNRIRDFIYGGLAILAASSLFSLLTQTALLEDILPTAPPALRLGLLCFFLAVFDYIFFRYSCSVLRLPIYLGFISGIVIRVLEVQALVLLICLCILCLQNGALLQLLITLLLLLGSLFLMLTAGTKR